MAADIHLIDPRVAVIQDCDRLDYLLPRALHQAGVLDRVFTDWYACPGSTEAMAAKLLKLAKYDQADSLGRRFTNDIESRLVRSKPLLRLSHAWQARKLSSPIDRRNLMSDLIGRWVLDQGLGDCNVMLGFVRDMFPGLCATVRSNGVKVVSHQADPPAGVEHTEAARQVSRFAAWTTERPTAMGRRLTEIEQGTWETSDLITCQSEFIRDSLIHAGVPAKKIALLSTPVDQALFPLHERRGRTGPIVVGFVGDVSLRQGAPYFMEVARRVDPEKIKFVMVGPSSLVPAVVEQYRDAIELTGPLPMEQIAERMKTFDVFLAPSTGAGSSAMIAAAMASGLPIITSLQAGSRMRHSIDGFICPYDDSDRMAHCVNVLATDAAMRYHFGKSAYDRVKMYDFGQFANDLKVVLSRVVNPEPLRT